MKVYIFYCNGEHPMNDEATDLTKLRFNIPNEWLEKPCKLLLEECLPKLLPSDDIHDLRVEDFEIKCGGLTLQCGDVIGKYIREYNELYIFQKKKREDVVIPEGHIRCTNFGCGIFFDPNDNKDKTCHYHSKGPVFHDLAKYWACCPQKKGYDWEQFQKIPTCQVGKHCAVRKSCSLEQETSTTALPMAPAAEKPSFLPAVPSAMETNHVQVLNETPSQIVDGKAKCRNYGCHQEFVVAENHSMACTYHKSVPVIRDIKKFWKCCPDKVCYEFDDFVKITGCCTGPHKL